MTDPREELQAIVARHHENNFGYGGVCQECSTARVLNGSEYFPWPCDAYRAASLGLEALGRPSDEQIVTALYEMKGSTGAQPGDYPEGYDDAIGDAMDIVSKMLLPFAPNPDHE